MFSKFVGSDLLHRASPWLVVQNFLHALIVIASNDQSQDRAREHVVTTQQGHGRSGSEKFWQTVCCVPNISLHTYVREIQLIQMQQGNGVLMSATTGQRARPQLGVRNRTMTSTFARHDHDVFAREEPMHSVTQTTVQRVAILGFQNGLRNSRLSTNVYPQTLVVVGIIENSAVDHPY